MPPPLFQEILDYRRKGVSFIKFWEFILASTARQEAWKSYQSFGIIDLAMWKFLLDPSRKKFLLKWEQTYGEEGQEETSWQCVLRTSPSLLQQEALEILGSLQEKALGISPFLMELLQETQEETLRRKLILTLGRISLGTKESIRILLPLLHHGDPQARETTIQMISKQQIKEGIPALIQALQDEHFKVRYAARMALGKMGSKRSKETLPLLLEALKESQQSPLIRAELLLVLGILGNKASEAIPSLIETLQEKNEEIALNSLWTLSKMGAKAEEAVPIIVKTFQNENVPIRRNVVWALSKIGIHALSALLHFALQDPDLSLRLYAIEKIGTLGKKAQEGIPDLFLLLKDPHPDIQKETALALKHILDAKEKSSEP
jgi:HEAT repeat protein